MVLCMLGGDPTNSRHQLTTAFRGANLHYTSGLDRYAVLSSLMRIGELSDRAGVSHRTIHYYERLGLIKPAEREGAGYRYYDEITVKRLEKIAFPRSPKAVHQYEST